MSYHFKPGSFLLGLILSFTISILHSSAQSIYQDSSRPREERVIDLLDKLTIEEKISLLGYNSPGVPRLGIPTYNWWNEALHGVARAGNATVFPQAIALAATFNDSLLHRVADAISTEARAKHTIAIKMNNRTQYLGLTFWSPNINIFRDPRWGRGQETYGEDPYLTGRMGSSFVRGLQGDNSKYLKTSACAKHFAVHSGPEASRHTFDAIVNEKDLRETYLYAFKKLVDTGVESVMCGYNRVNGEPCCTSNTLLRKILREEWNFGGHIVTDCWALEDIWKRHKVMNNSVEVAAEAVRMGINMDCSNLLQDDLKKAIDQKLISPADINAAITPSLRTQFKLGFYDDHNSIPYNSLDEGDVHNEKHIALARTAAQQSMVLLKNNNHLLPLRKELYKSILVTGTNSGSPDALLGNYHGVSSNLVTFIEGITDAAGPGIVVQYDMGSDYNDTTRFGGLWVSENSDVTIAVIGLTPVYEGEEGDAFLAKHGGDKEDLDLPAGHVAFMKALRQRHKKPIVAIVTGGSAVNIASIEPFADAILFAWYPGEMGGAACADILFGKVSPAGRLPVTFYQSLNDLPPYDNYDMKGRTYRYFDGEVMYPFGYGLSYSTFSYEWKKNPLKRYKANDTISIALSVKNTGDMDADEVVQVYIKYPEGKEAPLLELRQFDRISILRGKQKDVFLKIPITEIQKWNSQKERWEAIKGKYEVMIGKNSKEMVLRAPFEIK